MQREDPVELNFADLQMQKWNILRDKPQKADEKNRIIWPVIMFPPRIMAIKMLKMAHFLYFLLMTAKSSSEFEQNV